MNMQAIFSPRNLLLFCGLALGLASCSSSKTLRLAEPKFLLTHYQPEGSADTVNLSGEVSFKIIKQEKNPRKPEQWMEDKGLNLSAKVYHDGATSKALMRKTLSEDFAKDHRTFKNGSKTMYLAQIIEQGEDLLFFYGNPPNEFHVITEPSLLRIYSQRTKQFSHTLDFGRYSNPPEYLFREKDFVFEKLLWARLENNRLYVQNAHWTYAESSKGSNAYLTAIDLSQKGKVLWRSQPLVGNAVNFADYERFFVTAYGFTRETGYVYAIDKQTGKVVGSLEIFPKGNDAQKHISFVIAKGRVIHLKLGDDTEYEIEVRY